MKAYIECGLCRKIFECDINESPDNCAKKHKLIVLSFKDIDGYSESMYVCKDCFGRHVYELFNYA